MLFGDHRWSELAFFSFPSFFHGFLCWDWARIGFTFVIYGQIAFTHRICKIQFGDRDWSELAFFSFPSMIRGFLCWYWTRIGFTFCICGAFIFTRISKIQFGDRDWSKLAFFSSPNLCLLHGFLCWDWTRIGCTFCNYGVIAFIHRIRKIPLLRRWSKLTYLRFHSSIHSSLVRHRSRTEKMIIRNIQSLDTIRISAFFSNLYWEFFSIQRKICQIPFLLLMISWTAGRRCHDESTTQILFRKFCPEVFNLRWGLQSCGS